MKDKKSFIAYSDWKETFDNLPNDVAGELIKHIFAYVNDEDPKSDNYIINALFANIKNALNRDLKKWDEQRQQRSEAGKKSAALRATKSNDRSISFNEAQRNSTVSVSVSDSVSDNVNVNLKKPSIDENKFSPEIRNLSKLLFSLMRKNNNKAKQPNFNSWDEHIDKLHRIDGYEINQIRNVINWCQNDDFWKSNILSTEKLRKQFAQLAIKANSQKNKIQQPTSVLTQTEIIR
ncbi:DUF6291 domain-containing protein [Winogradskyella sp.]|nr:DUF6291 domain-containing protein [Winogradskyella sp.]